MTADASQRYGVVRIGDVMLGIPIRQLAEVFPVLARTSLPNTSDLLCGGVELRGQFMPLLDLAACAGINVTNDGDDLGVVVECDKRTLAFEVQEIIGIAEIADSDLREMRDGKDTGGGLFSALFSYKGHLVSVVDVNTLLEFPGVQSTTRREVSQRASQTKEPPMMTFMAGGALFAVPAFEVYAAVPKQAIDATAIVSGPCIGEIRYHDRRVPVLCPVSILGLGRRNSKRTSEVIVLRFPNDLVVGFAVDTIHDIRSYPLSSKANVPIRQSDQSLIKCVFICEGQEDDQVFAVDVDALREDHSLQEIAGLSRLDDEDKPEATQSMQGGDANLILERERFLIVEAKYRFAVPLLQVSCILEPPNVVTEKVASFAGFKGYFGHLGHSIALIDLRELKGFGAVGCSTAQVLLTGTGDDQIGFLVDKVLGIEMSQWREKEAANDGSPHDVLVQLGTEDAQAVLPYLDLLGTVSAMDVPDIALDGA